LLWPTLLAPVAASAFQLNYLLEVGIEHNDNVALSEDHPVTEDILRPSLGFNLTEQGSEIQAAATGNLEYRDYLHNRFSNEFRGQLDSRLNWTAIAERLNFTVQDNLSLQPINTLAADSPSNLQQTNVFAAGPTLSFRLGQSLRGQAELRYINSAAEDTKEFNSQRVSAALRALKDINASTVLSANLVDERVDFSEDGVSPNYSRYSAFGRYARKWNKFDLTTDLGYSWLRYSGSDNSGLDRQDPLARADLAWHVSQQSTLTLEVAQQLSDAASDMLLSTEIGPRIPASIATGDASITPAAYLERRVQFAYAYQGVRADFSVAPYYRKLEYSNGFALDDINGGDQNSHGATLTAAWKLRPLISIGLSATGDDLKYDQLAREDKTWMVQAFFRQQWTRHWSWRAELTHYKRESNAIGQNSDQNYIYVAMTYTR
jgi:hypothetical protein